MTAQQELSRALENGDLNDFKEVLKLQVNPCLSLLEPNSMGINIYEKALTSSKDLCGEFIKICFVSGCSPNYINKRKKAAINFAADSRNPENIRRVLEALHANGDPIIHLDNKYNDLTPLNSLAKNADQSNADAVFECMRLLLDYGASPNIPDDLDNTPLHKVLYNTKISLEQKQKLIELLLDQPRINIGEDLRNELLNWNPNVMLPQPNGGSVIVDFDGLSKQLRRDNQVQFINLLQGYPGDRCAFLPKCIINGFHDVFDVLHSATDCDINKKSVDNKSYVEIAVIHGNWYALEKLLQHNDLVLANNMQILHLIIGRLDEKPSNSFSDYMKCFLQLVSCGKVNVNQTDISGRTPLHYAIRYGHQIAVRELLRHGAYLGTRSKFNELAIQDIDALVLKQHFDDCITSNDESRGSHNFEIILDYRSLKLPDNLAKSSLCNEMEPICAMSNSKELRHLLNHPLIFSFISFKQDSTLKLLYVHFLITLIFSIMFVTNLYLMFFSESNAGVKSAFLILSWLSIVYFIVCELVKPLRTFLMWRVFNLGFIVISVSCIIIGSFDPEMYYSRIIAAFTILLWGIKLTVLIGSLPVQFLATPVLMLQEVLSTFLRSCLPYFFLVTSFALAFYMLDFYALSKKGIVEAILKTIVVSTGEFNESDIDYRHDPFAKAFFLIFVVFVSIVLMNLLSALAIYDTQAIQALAEVNSLIFATNSIKCCELSLGVSWGRFEFLRFIKVKIPKIPSVVHIFPNKDDIETNSVNTHDAEMEPLVNGNTIKQVQILKKLDNETLKKIMEIIDRRLTQKEKQR